MSISWAKETPCTYLALTVFSLIMVQIYSMIRYSVFDRSNTESFIMKPTVTLKYIRWFDIRLNEYRIIESIRSIEYSMIRLMPNNRIPNNWITEIIWSTEYPNIRLNHWTQLNTWNVWWLNISNIWWFGDPSLGHFSKFLQYCIWVVNFHIFSPAAGCFLILSKNVASTMKWKRIQIYD